MLGAFLSFPYIPSLFQWHANVIKWEKSRKSWWNMRQFLKWNYDKKIVCLIIPDTCKWCWIPPTSIFCKKKDYLHKVYVGSKNVLVFFSCCHCFLLFFLNCFVFFIDWLYRLLFAFQLQETRSLILANFISRNLPLNWSWNQWSRKAKQRSMRKLKRQLIWKVINPFARLVQFSCCCFEPIAKLNPRFLETI